MSKKIVIEKINTIIKEYVKDIPSIPPEKGVSEFEYYYGGLAQAIVSQLDLNEVAELDEGKISDTLAEVGVHSDYFYDEATNAIRKAKLIKWKEK